MIDPVDLAADLVRIPSPSTDADGMQAIQQHVSALLSEHVPGARISTGGEERPWTLISLGPSGPAPLFACHTDTVPVGEPSSWSRDPHSGEMDSTHLHGRGAVDMKGGLAAVTAALTRAAAQGTGGHLLLTADEEIGSLGAQRTGEAIADLDLTGIIVPEATALDVRCAHRGASWLRLIARGRAAHGSAPARGVNAVLRLSKALGPALAAAPLRHDTALGEETVSIGTFEGGDATNIVPATAFATVDQRTVADSAPLLEHWRQVDGIDEVETILDLAALRTDPQAPFVRSLPAPLDPTPVTYFTDGSVLQGFCPDIPIVVWGPGDATQMHSVDERVELAQLTTATDLFTQVLLSRR
ncbi:M20 family metallopeptidase [Brachybacterium sp. GCM10030252]|uniref:M20 family metallopeptidase n=1 Tax=Brachybacterium sp. GCM10030252 TaxID=3273380 RepID=UPI00360A7A3D